MTEHDWAKKGQINRSGVHNSTAIPATVPAPALARDAGQIEISAITRNWEGLKQVSSTQPADTAIAVGKTYILQAVNSQVSLFNKDGVQEAGFPKSLGQFFGLAGTPNVFHPRAIYDWVQNRYIVMAIRADFANRVGYVELAVSKTDDPRGAWWTYEVAMGSTGICPEYPALGQDRLGIYLSVNKFGCTTSGYNTTFQDNEVWILQKSTIYSGAAFTFWSQAGFTAGGTVLDTLQPANVLTKYDNPRAEFLVNSLNINSGGGSCYTGCSGLIVWAISNPFGYLTGGPSPRFTGVMVPTAGYYLSMGAAQPSCPNGTCVKVGDTRIGSQVVYTSGSLFASANTAVLGTSPEQTSFYWWEIGKLTLTTNDPACTGSYLNACPQLTSASLLQEQCFACSPSWTNAGSAYFGAVQPDPEKNLTIAYGFASNTVRPSLAYATRRVTQAQNTTLDTGTIVTSGLANYSLQRWGDYTAIATDFASSTQPYSWFSGMYVKGNGQWGTRVVKNGYTTANQP